MHDIGTLGGPDAVSTTQSAHGQITGQSWTSSTPNPATGIPTLDPFLWANGHMRKLGTLGGDFGFANWVSNRGDVVGGAQAPGQTFHGFLWRNGKMHDLPPVGGAPSAFANGVNDHGQIVGDETDAKGNERFAVLWSGGHGLAISTADRGGALLSRCDTYRGKRGVCMNQIVGPPSGARCSSTIWRPRD